MGISHSTTISCTWRLDQPALRTETTSRGPGFAGEPVLRKSTQPIWAWVEIKPPKGPLVLVHVSLPGFHFGVTRSLTQSCVAVSSEAHPKTAHSVQRHSLTCLRSKSFKRQAIWVWLKIKQEGLHRFWSMFPLPRVPFGYRSSEPQPYVYLRFPGRSTFFLLGAAHF